MQQRRPRLGDILDDYCPRERRITNHAVVAMIDEDVKQTRCTTCDSEHEYKEAKIPSVRRKRTAGLLTDIPEASRPGALTAPPRDEAPLLHAAEPPDDAYDSVPQPPEVHAAPERDAESADEPEEEREDDARGDDEWPVHRRLIRATLPRPEGQVPERKAPEFTVRQQGGREPDGNTRNAYRGARGFRGQRQAPGGQGQGQPPQRFGGSRQGSSPGRQGNSPGGGQGQRQGNRPGQRGGGRPAAVNRGPGRKRGR